MKTPPFAYADYDYAPGFGCHVRRFSSVDSEALPPKFRLSEPLYADPFKRMHTVAIGGNEQRACCLYAELNPSPVNGLFYSIERMPTEVYFLVFAQQRASLVEPFSLLAFRLDDVPDSFELWSVIPQILSTLPGDKQAVSSWITPAQAA